MRERKVWRAPAWLFPDLRGIADPGQEPDHRGEVVLHREQYVSHADVERSRHFAHQIPAGRGWTSADREENNPGGTLRGLGRNHTRRGGRASIPRRGVVWPEDVVGLLVTPVSMRLDRGQLEHPKKRLRQRPAHIVTCGRGWRALAGVETDLIVLVRHAPKREGFGLHRIARTVRRDGGERDAHLLLNDGHDGDLRSPSWEDLDQFVRKAADRFTRLVDLTWHDAGAGVVVDGSRALPERLADDATERFPEVSQVSVRGDLLRDPGEVDRVAAEVSAMLLETDGGAG
jgi:hypothetical protein